MNLGKVCLNLVILGFVLLIGSCLPYYILFPLFVVFVVVVLCWVAFHTDRNNLNVRYKNFDGDFEITGIDYIEFYVGNAKPCSYWWQTALGFTPIAFFGDPELGGDVSKGFASYVLRQGDITFLLTSPLNPDSPINEKLNEHGDYVIKTVALTVSDSRKAYEVATGKGARSFQEPKKLEDEDGYVITSGIFVNWGDGEVVHVFIERKNYFGNETSFLPGFMKFPENQHYKTIPLGLKRIDHIVPNLVEGRQKEVNEFYRKILGLDLSYELKERNKFTSVDLEVMSNDNETVRFNLIQSQNESSFAEYFLKWYQGEGINHIAVEVGDIVHVVREMRKRGVEFYENVPDVYYETMEERSGPIEEDIETLKELKILVDRDEDGYLLQIFAKTFGVRPTIYLEIIDRKGAKHYGNGTIVRKLMSEI